VLLLCASAVISNAENASNSFSFQGMWASNDDREDTTRDSDFLSIQKYDDKRFIVISYSTSNADLDFIAGGTIGQDGVLHVKTEGKAKWAITRAAFYDGRTM